MTVRLRLHEILKERKMSQRKLALLASLRPNTISHLCSDKVDKVSLDTLDILCNVLEIELEELIVREKE